MQLYLIIALLMLYSGGLPIDVKVTNLHVVHSPRMCVRHGGAAAGSICEVCQINSLLRIRHVLANAARGRQKLDQPNSRAETFLLC